MHILTKKITTFLLLLTVYASSIAQNSYDHLLFGLYKYTVVEESINNITSLDLSVVNHVKTTAGIENRLIEPTSPILGKNLVQYIKSHPGHPNEIFHELTTNYKDLNKEIITSSLAYFNTLMPELKTYCQKKEFSTAPPAGEVWTQVEPSAIPLEVLVPLHSEYLNNMFAADDYIGKDGTQKASDSAIALATTFQEMKTTCPSVVKILRKDKKLQKAIPGKVRDLIKLNAEISSAEAAYPRLQHSINGYLQYTYNNLLEHENLMELLNITYEAQQEWVKRAKNNHIGLSFISFVEHYIVDRGFSYRDALLVLAYSTRNMPNIDVQYVTNPYRSLALEIYFWKFKELQNYVTENHFADIFPNYEFKNNPMLYHYTTASYLAYEIKKSQHTSFTAVSMALMSKAGYKFLKFINATDHNLLSNEGIVGLIKLSRQQSSISGIKAGYFGGKHGVKTAKKEQKRLKHIARTSNVVAEKTKPASPGTVE